MNMQGILEKIAYCYYLKFKALGQHEDDKRDFRCAEKALNHLLLPKNEGDYWWRFHEEDYNEFRKFVDDFQ
jgi:hypothetical protein